VARLRDPRTLPWAAILAVGRIVYDRFQEDVKPQDRKRLGALLRKSRGNPARLTERERNELFTIVRNVDVRRLSRDAAGAVSISRASKLLKRR
jgi:hypothetical protein